MSSSARATIPLHHRAAHEVRAVNRQRKSAPVPALTVVGESVVIVGTGFGLRAILKSSRRSNTCTAARRSGLNTTVTGGVPALTTSAARIAAVNCVALTNVVTRAVPLKFTVELAMKPVPFTVSVSAPEPETTPVGESEVITGAGLCWIVHVERN